MEGSLGRTTTYEGDAPNASHVAFANGTDTSHPPSGLTQTASETQFFQLSAWSLTNGKYFGEAQ